MEDVVGIGTDKRAGRDGSELDRSGMDIVEVEGSKVGDDEVGKNGQKMFKFKKTVRSDFFIPRARLTFTKLRKAFVKAPIFYHFNPERYI